MPRNRRKKSAHSHKNDYSGKAVYPEKHIDKKDIDESAFNESDDELRKKCKKNKIEFDDLDFLDGLILLLLLREIGFFEEDFYIPDAEEYINKTKCETKCCEKEKYTKYAKNPKYPDEIDDNENEYFEGDHLNLEDLFYKKNRDENLEETQ